MRLLNLVLIVGVCFAYHNIATIRAEKEAKIAAENSGLGSWKDGTYEGSGQGFGGQIVVSVTIKNGSIDDIQIKEAKNEDSAYFNNAKKIIDTMKQKQTADVDVASGATYSSKGIIAAVQKCFEGGVIMNLRQKRDYKTPHSADHSDHLFPMDAGIIHISIFWCEICDRTDQGRQADRAECISCNADRIMWIYHFVWQILLWICLRIWNLGRWNVCLIPMGSEKSEKEASVGIRRNWTETSEN